MTTAPTRRTNGVDTETLFATIDAVRQQPELARFQFRSTTRWLDGTWNRTTIAGFHGAGGEQGTDRAGNGEELLTRQHHRPGVPGCIVKVLPGSIVPPGKCRQGHHGTICEHVFDLQARRRPR